MQQGSSIFPCLFGGCKGLIGSSQLQLQVTKVEMAVTEVEANLFIVGMLG